MTTPDTDLLGKRALVISAWTAILIVSDLPDILYKSTLGQVPGWLSPVKLGFLVLFVATCVLWARIRSLWEYALVLLVLFSFLRLTSRIRDTAWYESHFAGAHPSFTSGYMGVYLLDTIVALAVIATLWSCKRRRSDFFLVRGRVDAPIEPVRWLGIRQGKSWKTFGWIFAGAAGVGVLFPTLFSIRPSTDMIVGAAPLLPSVLLFAAINAFNEEAYFRVSLLGTLHGVIGRTHTQLINVAFFGLAHYLHGTPPGIIGFLMTGFLAWLLGKSMLETRGFLWAWFIHFVPDVMIFITYAVLWVGAGSH